MNLSNNRDEFNSDTPLLEVDNSAFKITYDQLVNLASEFFGKVLENQLITAGNEELPNKWMVEFPQDKDNSADTLKRRHDFKRALDSFKITK